jgi:hypothetical protein
MEGNFPAALSRYPLLVSNRRSLHIKQQRQSVEKSMGKGGWTERICGTRSLLQMIPVLSTVQNVEKHGHEYFITVLVGCEGYSGTFDMLVSRTNPILVGIVKVALTGFTIADLNYKTGDLFPLWTI